MAIVACKECGKEVSSQARLCPHCGVKVKASSAGKVFVWLIFGLVGFLLFGAVVGRSPAADERALCKDRVLSYLKSPSTAEFSNVGEMGGLVVGYVDAQNGFGATIRNGFSCKVEMNHMNKPYIANVCIDGKSAYGKNTCY